jgi:phage antirepressor YoqD-like protein
MEEIKKFEFEGNEITFLTGENTMVNATQMANYFDVKPNFWLKTDGAQKIINKYAELKNINTTDLVKVKQGGNPNEQGTWMHEDIALVFAQWLSPEFYIWCNDRIKELLVYGITTTLKSSEPILVLSNTTRTIAEVAKLLNENKTDNGKVSSHKINQMLRANRYFKPNNQPYQKWMNQGLFIIEQYNLKYNSAKRITVTDNKGLPVIQQLFGQKYQLSPVIIKNNNQSVEPTYNNQIFLLKKINEGRLTRLEETMLTTINHMLACLNHNTPKIEIENYRTQLRMFKTETEK